MKTAYFFDMDGTLYNRKFHEVSEKTFSALSKLKEEGNVIGLATSRALMELSKLPSCMRNFPFDVRILDGGAYIIKDEDTILEKSCIDPSLMKKIDIYCREKKLDYRYSTPKGNYFGLKPSLFIYQIYMDLYLTTPEYKPYDNDEVVNLLVTVDCDQTEQEIREIFKGHGIVKYPNGLEIRADGLDKAVAIQEVCKELEVDQIVCFGDGYNDIDMLKMADIGVAMGNACQECKDIADVVIGHIDEDPIYTYLIQNNLCKEE